MDHLNYIQNYMIDGQTVKQKLEKRYSGYKLNWLVKDGEIMSWNDILPLDGGKHYYAMSSFRWRIESDRVTAYNLNAMKLTPELAMLRIVKK